MPEKKVFCIIPAYNEENNIKKVIEDLVDVVHSLILVVDGGNDKTFERALEAKKELNKKGENIHILKHVINRGQGAALQTGNEFSLKMEADLVVHFDADGQFLAEDIKVVVKPLLEDEADVVFGSRFLGKESNIPWFKKNVIFKIARLFNYFFIKIKLTDPQSGFRAMNRKALSLITIEQDKMAHCSEILFKVGESGLRVKEVPVLVLYNEYGQNFSGGFKIVRDIMFSKIFK